MNPEQVEQFNNYNYFEDLLKAKNNLQTLYDVNETITKINKKLIGINCDPIPLLNLTTVILCVLNNIGLLENILNNQELEDRNTPHPSSNPPKFG